MTKRPGLAMNPQARAESASHGNGREEQNSAALLPKSLVAKRTPPSHWWLGICRRPRDQLNRSSPPSGLSGHSVFNGLHKPLRRVERRVHHARSRHRCLLSGWRLRSRISTTRTMPTIRTAGANGKIDTTATTRIYCYLPAASKVGTSSQSFEGFQKARTTRLALNH